eukprot:CAMPEP_0118798172 /NCGR_PEP_ID=MMETSP1161-20130426/604_1 /TAXON_ID=249345 /ORGANISM="Picochlorum oklahomensis, Strain CCMP2329" /LENGTH=315 /DNA_ID=CAMNT_0006725507 /DNA_START=339 /DNA_END=1286 /DNA_ORIENTATION=-
MNEAYIEQTQSSTDVSDSEALGLSSGEPHEKVDQGEKEPEPSSKNGSTRAFGHVKWFNCSKGFGFITMDGTDEEVFVHQSNIDTEGFRSLQEEEPVEFDLVVGEDGKKKAFHVTGPGGAPPRGHYHGHSGRPVMPGMELPGMEGRYIPQGLPGQAYPVMGRMPQGPSGPGMPPHGYYTTQLPPEAFMGYYPMSGSGYPQYSAQQVISPSGRGFFPGGQNWAGARPPPPGQPGFSSGLQVVVHNLPWDCTWQQLKNAFESCGEIERADVVFDSQGRSRGFGIVRFPNQESAELAVKTMNNKTIGGRVVSVRVDRFA